MIVNFGCDRVGKLCVEGRIGFEVSDSFLDFGGRFYGMVLFFELVNMYCFEESVL